MQTPTQPTKGSGVILAAKQTIATHIRDVANHPDEVAASLATIARSTGANGEFATRFAAGAIAYLSKHGEALAECTPQTFLGAIMALAQAELTLDPAAGLAYLLPFRRNTLKGVDDKGKKIWESVQEVQLAISYKGYITLLKREYPDFIVNFHYVLKGEKFKATATGVTEHHLDLDARYCEDVTKFGRTTFFYADVYPYGAKGKSPYKQFFLISSQEIERRRLMNKSQQDNQNNSPLKDAWEKSPFAMAFSKLMRDITKKFITIDPKGTPKESLAIGEEYTYSATIDSDDVNIYSEYTEPPTTEAEAVTPDNLQQKTQAFFDALTAIADDPTTTRANVRTRISATYKEAKDFFGSDAQLPSGFVDRMKQIAENAKEEAQATQEPTEGENNNG